MSQDVARILEAFRSGSADHIYTFLGCHKAQQDGCEGYVFRVWAPHAQTVSVVGDFNFWNEEDLPMRPIGGGVWEAFSVYAKAGGAYVMLSAVCDWTVGFFHKQGYTVRGALEDYPRGHTGYEIEKRI